MGYTGLLSTLGSGCFLLTHCGQAQKEPIHTSGLSPSHGSEAGCGLRAPRPILELRG